MTQFSLPIECTKRPYCPGCGFSLPKTSFRIVRHVPICKNCSNGGESVTRAVIELLNHPKSDQFRFVTANLTVFTRDNDELGGIARQLERSGIPDPYSLLVKKPHIRPRRKVIYVTPQRHFVMGHNGRCSISEPVPQSG